MKTLIAVISIFVSCSAFAANKKVNCFWTESQEGSKRAIGATSVSGEFADGTIRGLTATLVTILEPARTFPQTLVSYGIFDADKSMYFTYFQTDDTDPIIYTISTKLDPSPGDDMNNGIFVGTVRLQMPPGNSFSFPVTCSLLTPL